MKKFAALLAIVLVLAAAGCSNGNKSETADDITTAASDDKDTENADGSDGSSTDSGSGEGSDTEMSAEEETQKAMEYIEEQAPLYAAYLRKHSALPLTYETEITADGKTWLTKLFVKDDHTCAQYSLTPGGVETKVIYKDGKGYQIDSENKTYYEQDDLGEGEIKAIVSSLRLSELSYASVLAAQYDTDMAEYEGTEYDRVTITDPANGAWASHYFDKATGEIKYSEIGFYVTKVLTFENTIDDSVFDIPSDYEKKSFEDLQNETNSQYIDQSDGESERKESSAE